MENCRINNIRKVIYTLLIIILIFPISLRESFAIVEISEGLSITTEDLESPKNLTIEIDHEENLIIGWQNPEGINNRLQTPEQLYSIYYQIDFKVGRDEWLSMGNEDLLPTKELTFRSDGRFQTYFDPVAEGLTDDKIDLAGNSYYFRVRYRYSYDKDGFNHYINGEFSNAVSLGLQPSYRNCSDWAIPELDKAVDLGFITDKIKNNMKASITREELCEVIIRMYENQTGRTISYTSNPFTDTTNTSVLKASELGIVNGVGANKFAPDESVTRQDMNVMVYRTIKLLKPEIDYNVLQTHKFADENLLAPWAADAMQFMFDKGLFKGVGGGNIDPLGSATREGAVILLLRSYEMIYKL